MFQLTWLSGKTYFYDVNNFANSTIQNTPLKDGWGATTDGRYLIVSDGSSNLTWLDPDTLKAVKSVAVTDDGKPVPQLNEVRFCIISSNAWQALHSALYSDLACIYFDLLVCGLMVKHMVYTVLHSAILYTCFDLLLQSVVLAVYIPRY